MQLETKVSVPAIKSKHCGDLYEIQDGKHYQCSVVYSPNMLPTTGHFHTNMDEQYVVLKGSITVELYDPVSKKRITQDLKKLESLIIKRGVHHRIISTESPTEFLTICMPGWQSQYEYDSDVLI